MAQECKKKSKSLLTESPWLCRQFLAAQLEAAAENNDIRKANNVKAIMKAESHRKGWNAIKKEMGQKCTPAPMIVETQRMPTFSKYSCLTSRGNFEGPL